MKTPYLDKKINELEILISRNEIAPKGIDAIKEFKAIKQLIENSPIVSTPEKPVWVVDGSGEKFMLIADLGEKVVNGRYVLIRKGYEEKFLNNEKFDYFLSDTTTPYTPKVNIEVTEEEAVKVEEFLKTLRK